MSISQHMLTNINSKITNNINDYKEFINNIISTNVDNKILLINEYEFPLLKMEDMNKKKRMKNNIPICERCEAKRASGERCSRRNKGASIYCGTHSKGTPHGKINDKQTSLKKVEIMNKDINGILYFIDNIGNVYNHEDIQHNKPNPRVLTQYTRNVNGDIVINL